MFPHQRIDISFDQVDQLDLASNACVKGIEAVPQQPQILGSRQIASASSRYVVMVDSSAVSVTVAHSSSVPMELLSLHHSTLTHASINPNKLLLVCCTDNLLIFLSHTQVVERLCGILPVVIDGGEGWEEPAEELDGGWVMMELLA